jgi:glucose-1-phosphate cytidylyltransferase
MSVVILAGGRGTRITEESTYRPKPMVEIGGRPILWHLMKYFASWGAKRFIVCAGYRAELIKQYFVDYPWTAGDVEVEIGTGSVRRVGSHPDDWTVAVIDTGMETMTGGRLRRIKHLLPEDRPFFMTYGDGLANVDLESLLKVHTATGRLATVTAVTPPGRFGALVLDGAHVQSFEEKPRGDGAFINGGFFVLEHSALNCVTDDSTSWEREPMELLSRNGQMAAYRHDGFWHPMDTLRDKNYLEEQWATGGAPWKRW